MAVIPCKTCGAKVNSEAVACPSCGADPRTGEGGSSKSEVEALIDIASDERRPDKERQCAIDALGNIGDRRAVDALIPLLHHTGCLVKAAQALAKIGDSRAVPHICYLVASQNEYVQMYGKAAIAELYNKDPVGSRRALEEYKQWRQEGAERFHARWQTDVAAWHDCPLCGATPSEAVEHVIRCQPCGYYFSDANFLPAVSQDFADYGRLLGASFIAAPMIPSADGHVTFTPWLTAMAWQALDAGGVKERGEPFVLSSHLMDTPSATAPTLAGC